MKTNWSSPIHSASTLQLCVHSDPVKVQGNSSKSVLFLYFVVCSQQQPPNVSEYSMGLEKKEKKKRKDTNKKKENTVSTSCVYVVCVFLWDTHAAMLGSVSLTAGVCDATSAEGGSGRQTPAWFQLAEAPPGY